MLQARSMSRQIPCVSRARALHLEPGRTPSELWTVKVQVKPATSYKSTHTSNAKDRIRSLGTCLYSVGHCLAPIDPARHHVACHHCQSYQLEPYPPHRG